MIGLKNVFKVNEELGDRPESGLKDSVKMRPGHYWASNGSINMIIRVNATDNNISALGMNRQISFEELRERGWKIVQEIPEPS